MAARWKKWSIVPRSASRSASPSPSRPWVRSPVTGLIRSRAAGPQRSISASRRSRESSRTRTWMSPSRSSSRSTRWRPMKPVAPVTKYAIALLRSCLTAQAYGRARLSARALPAALGLGGGLGRGLAAILALLELPLQQRDEEDEQREEDDEDEPGVRHDPVVRLAVPALAVVVREHGCGR